MSDNRLNAVVTDDAQKLVVMRGLPGCGKTTLTRQLVATNPARWVRVNRDDLRAMGSDGFYVKGVTERLVLRQRDALIREALKLGRSVVSDDTNLTSRHVRELRRIATLAGVGFEIIDLTDVPVETCVERDARRVKPVGETDIRGMWSRYVRGKPYPLPVAAEPLTVDSEPYAMLLEPYVPPVGGRDTYLVDIDGTVATMCDRSPYDETRVHEDRPSEDVIRIVNALYDAGNDIIVMSGRTNGCRDATMRWLLGNVRACYAQQTLRGDTPLYMRAVGDTRSDDVVKAELFWNHVRHDPDVAVRGVLDDRDKVVKMWRSIGLTCLQVNYGAF